MQVIGLPAWLQNMHLARKLHQVGLHSNLLALAASAQLS